MVDITPVVPADRMLVQAYGDGAFRIRGTQHAGSVIVFPDRVEPWTGEVSTQGLAAVLAAADSVDLLVLGCGPVMTPIPAETRAELRARGIVIDPMDTGAACRTWNVLLAEGRRAAAAMVAV